MKIKLLYIAIVIILLIVPTVNLAQLSTLGASAGFVLFSSNGEVTNTGISQITGHVGTNSGSSTAFGNVNGVMHDNDATSANCASDLLIAYNQLASATATFFPSPLLGNGDTLLAGVYAIAAASTLNLNLVLDAEGNPDALFIFQIQGAFSTNAASAIVLINGAKACNVFWKVEGAVDMAAATLMKGTVIANNAAINMGLGVVLEGRALSTTGAVSVNGVLAYTPVGCGSPALNGPPAPVLASTECFGIFSSNGAVINTGISTIIGDIGSNNGVVTGFDSLLVTGTIHLTPNSFTMQCADDLSDLYAYVNTLPFDIELLYPAQFGNNLVLTPHTYRMNGAATFTDTLYLDAMGNSDAVFVIQINGALTTGTYSKVLLINGTQSKNVYWKVEGAVDINNYSVFHGTIICNNGAMGVLNTGVVLNGRALLISGALNTASMSVMNAEPCIISGVEPDEATNDAKTALLYPNPFTNSLTIVLNDYLKNSTYELHIYNQLGAKVIHQQMLLPSIRIETNNLQSGIYFYTIINNHKIIQSGKVIAQQ